MIPFMFGTVGAPLSTPKKPGGSVGAIQHLASLGLYAFELGWVQSVRVSEETCNAIREAAKAYNVQISVHAPYFINLNADDDEWQKSRKRLMDAAYYGALAGATDIIFHPGSYFSMPPSEVLPKAIKRLEGCVRELQEMETQVTLRPETMGKSAMLGSLEDVLEMSKALPEYVQPCLDFAHLHARTGTGALNTREEWLRVLDQVAEALGADALQSLHIHLSGIEYSEKGEKNHLKLEESDLNLKGLFTALYEKKCTGRILCESPVLEEDALLMKQRWIEWFGE